MRVVIDGTPAINDARAIQRYTYHLIDQLGSLDTEDKFSVMYMYERNSSAQRPPLDGARFRTFGSRVPGRILSPIMRTFGFPSVESQCGYEPDLVHYPGGLPHVPTRAPIRLTTVHGFAHIRIPETMSKRTREILTRLYARSIPSSTHFITVSETMAGELTDLFGVDRERITAIPLGVSPEFEPTPLLPEAADQLRRRFSIPTARVALFVGAIEPHKNIENSLRAFARFLPDASDPWHFVLVGSLNEFRSRVLELIAELGLEDRVTFVDYIQPGSQELSDLYKLSEVMVFPTCYEGWASPPLEAMRSNKPVIASNIPSLIESTGGCALYPDPHDVQAITESIAELAENPERYAELQRSGLEFASQYTWERCARRTFELYATLAGEPVAVPAS